MNQPQHQEASDADYAALPKPGEQLRKAREAKGFSIQDVVTQIRLERRLLEAIESDNYAKLPAPGYVRGYIRTYARFLGLDTDPLIEAFNREAEEAPVLQPYASTPAQQAHSGDRLVKAVTWAIGIGLVVLVVVWWRSQYLHRPRPQPLAGNAALSTPLAPAPPPPTVKAKPANGLGYTYPIIKHPDELTPGSAASGAGPAAAEAPVTPGPAASEAAAPAAAITSPSAGTPVPAGQTSAAPAAGTTPASPETAAPATQPAVPPASATLASPAARTAALEQPAATAQAPAAAPTASGGTAHQLVLKLNQASWIEVTDATGKRLYYNLGRAGQTIDLSGEPPLHVLLGYSPGVDISYDGKSLDVSARSHNGVARFQIKQDGSVE